MEPQLDVELLLLQVGIPSLPLLAHAGPPGDAVPRQHPVYGVRANGVALGGGKAGDGIARVLQHFVPQFARRSVDIDSDGAARFLAEAVRGQNAGRVGNRFHAGVPVKA